MTLTIQQLLERLQNYAHAHPDTPVVFQVEGSRASPLFHTSLIYDTDEGGKLILHGRPITTE